MSKVPVTMYKVGLYRAATLERVLAAPAGARYIQINNKRVQRESSLCKYFESYDAALEAAKSQAESNLQAAKAALARAERYAAILETVTPATVEECRTSY